MSYQSLEEGGGGAAGGWPSRAALAELMDERSAEALGALTAGGGVERLCAMLGTSAVEGISGADLKERFAAFGENEDLDAANAAERDMIKQIKQEKRDQEERRVKAFDDMIREARAAHAAAEAAKQLEGVSFSGDPIHGVNGPLRDENADPNKPRKPFVDVEDLD